jgi:hypothetical protein
MSTTEPDTQPVTFRALFAKELRAHREHMGLLVDARLIPQGGDQVIPQVLAVF